MDHIVSLAIPRPLDGLYTYRVPKNFLNQIRVGCWVRVPFGRVKTHAFVVDSPKPISELDPSVKPELLKDILSVGEGGPIIPADVLELCLWTQKYTQAPIGEILNSAVPAASLGLRNRTTKPRELKNMSSGCISELVLTEEQKDAANLIENLRASPVPVLLEGVTGSGKTEVYLELARRTLQGGKGVLILAPEIALTPQLHRRLEEGLGERVALWHSAMSDGVRRDQAAALRDGKLRVIVGARSAVFAPVQNLGLIIVDEEHDPTYKQEDRVRYHARDLAVVRGKICNSLVVLGSATPSLESLERVRDGKYKIAFLKNRYASGGTPALEIVDLREESLVQNLQAPLAERTLAAIRETLQAGQQVMIFLNRRGFAAFLLCEECGEVTECPNCSISLTVHKRKGQLRCHVCGHVDGLPSTCSKCQGTALKLMGAGTESLEEELPKAVEEMIPLRLDRDQVTSAKRLESVLNDFRAGHANTLLGTQMLVKGHDFPRVTLVVVMLADALFRWPDFRAGERAYQVITQVAGRAGRGELPGRVLVQTYQPEHPVIQMMTGQIEKGAFLENERELRMALSYPPFSRICRLRVEHESRAEAQTRITRIAAALTDSEITVLGPSEAFLEKAKGIYRWDVLLKAGKIGTLQKAVMNAKACASMSKWPLVVDMDPYGVG